jgi:flagellar M-ring protein FliF
MTDFTQRIDYRRALEGELERVVSKMRGIESAQVHLVLHETDGFSAQDRPTEASVVLKLKGEADPEVVKGIAHLVASSVEGLTST